MTQFASKPATLQTNDIDCWDGLKKRFDPTKIAPD
ncbi:hypothetical protein [Bosea vaviloviae]